MAKIVNGREQAWQVLDVIGSGDAGEVLRVVSGNGKLQGVMKRPVQNVSGGTIVRQATQIETEGKILSALEGVDFTKNGLTIHTPLLLDQSIKGTSRSANLFMISEEIQGRSITSMLARQRNGGELIPQNLLLKVLSGALLLLERVHAKGLIWNDVKTDHIFWNAETKTMSFIDWGNGLFLQPQADAENSPIWQDYQQLFEEGANLLNQTSPALIKDLDWPLSAAGMTLQDIKQLQMRVDYFEIYLSMRAMEYQLLFHRFAKDLPDGEDLQQTLEYQKELRNFGVDAPAEEIYPATKALLIGNLDTQNDNAGIHVLDLLDKYLGEELPANWKLADFLIRSKVEVEQEDKLALIELVLESDWPEAVWLARKLIEKGASDQVLGSAIYSMRGLYLEDFSNKTIYSEILGFANSLGEQCKLFERYPDTAVLIQKIGEIRKQLLKLASTWAQLEANEPLGQKFLILKQILSSVNELRLKIPPSLNAKLQKPMILIREIYQAWNKPELSEALQSLKQLYITEPSLDYLLPMADSLKEMKCKVEAFREGPQGEQTIAEFAQELYDYKSPLTDQINQSNWQVLYNEVLRTILNAEGIEQVLDLAKQQLWPTEWIFQSDLQLRPVSAYEERELSSEQKQTLEYFHKQLTHNDPASLKLDELKRQLPSWYGSYKLLAEEFLFSFSSITRPDRSLSVKDFPKEDQAAITRSLEVLEQVEKWKAAASMGDWYLVKTMSASLAEDWRVLQDIKQTSSHWTQEILPALTEIKQRNWNSARFKQILKPHHPHLIECQSNLFAFVSLWQKIEYQGLYPELLSELSYYIDQAQSLFFRFWQELQKSPSPATAWLVARQQSVFSEINQTLLTLLRYLRGLQRNYEVVNQSSMARTRLAQNSAGDLVFTLIKIDELLHPGATEGSVFRRWQRQYLDLLATVDRDSIRRGIEEIESIHPLLPWFDELVKRDAGYFDQTDHQQW